MFNTHVIGFDVLHYLSYYYVILEMIRFIIITLNN